MGPRRCIIYLPAAVPNGGMPLVAVAHYPEGAGHATRMIAVANALRDRGAEVRVAGGGPGATFARLHGYREFEPTRVDYIGDYQGGGGLPAVFANSLPDSGRRVRDYLRWFGRIDPDGVVTDDMFAAMAAPLAGVPLYVLTHNAPVLYDGRVERAATWALTAFQVGVARSFLYPAVWPPVAGDPHGVERIPPVALQQSGGVTDGAESDGPGTGESALPAPEVLVVPSHYSTDSDGLAARIRRGGHDVTLVGDEHWEPVPSLVSVIERSPVVVCSGYSTVMEAAVAGTPCVVYPRTDEQRGVARLLKRNAVRGFRVARTPAAVVDAVENPPASSPRENGASPAAERVLADL